MHPVDSDPTDPSNVWNMKIDGSSNMNGSGMGVVLESPTGEKVRYALRLQFPATNDEAEYEALIAGLRLVKEMGLQQLRVYSDSQLVVNKVRGDYQAKGENMAAYVRIAGEQLKGFEWFKIEQVPRIENAEADDLARLASGLEVDTLRHSSIKHLSKPSRSQCADHVMLVDYTPCWIDPILEYLTKGKILEDKNEARKIKYQANRYTILIEKLYRRGYTMPYLRCLRPDEAEYVMREIHEGVCDNHSGKRSLAHKALRQGYYWPTMQKDSTDLVQRCDKCQRFAHIARQPPEQLSQVISPWPFAKRGMIGPLLMARAQAKFAIVAIDYFTKWVEAEPLSTITEAKCTGFIWKNIIYRFGVPHSIVTDNGK